MNWELPVIFIWFSGYPEQPGPSGNWRTGRWWPHAGCGPPRGWLARSAHRNTHKDTQHCNVMAVILHRIVICQVILWPWQILLFYWLEVAHYFCISKHLQQNYSDHNCKLMHYQGLSILFFSYILLWHIMAWINWILPCLGWRFASATSIKIF